MVVATIVEIIVQFIFEIMVEMIIENIVEMILEPISKCNKEKNTSLKRRGYSLTACNASPHGKSKMAARVSQNELQGLSTPRFVGAPVKFC